MNKYSAEQNFFYNESVALNGMWPAKKKEELSNEKYNVGEVVCDGLGHHGVVVGHFSKTGLYVIFPQYEVPQLVKAHNMRKV